MTAERLRAAAALMRSRAEVASDGSWRVVHDRYITAGDYPPSLIGCDEPSDAAHIASWHPAVAVAAADLLEACADRYAFILETFPVGSAVGAVTASENVTGWTQALAVANAYLGDPS